MSKEQDSNLRDVTIFAVNCMNPANESLKVNFKLEPKAFFELRKSVGALNRLGKAATIRDIVTARNEENLKTIVAVAGFLKMFGTSESGLDNMFVQSVTVQKSNAKEIIMEAFLVDIETLTDNLNKTAEDQSSGVNSTANVSE